MAWGSTDTILELEADNKRLKAEVESLKAEIIELKATLKFVREAAEATREGSPSPDNTSYGRPKKGR